MAHSNLIHYSFLVIFFEFIIAFFSNWERKEKLPLLHLIIYVAFNVVQSLVETCLTFHILTIAFRNLWFYLLYRHVTQVPSIRHRCRSLFRKYVKRGHRPARRVRITETWPQRLLAPRMFRGQSSLLNQLSGVVMGTVHACLD